MSSPSDERAWEVRAQRMEEALRKVQRRCGLLSLALLVATVIAIGTPLVLLGMTSLGSELKVQTLKADRGILPKEGQITFGEKACPKARIGVLPDQDRFGLAFYKADKQVILLRGEDEPVVNSSSHHQETNHARMNPQIFFVAVVVNVSVDEIQKRSVHPEDHQTARILSPPLGGEENEQTAPVGPR